jgi:hypothetical protein
MNNIIGAGQPAPVKALVLMLGRWLSVVALALAIVPRSEAAVVFQNTGRPEGWSSLGIQHAGKIDQVATPTYRGATALRMEQTFQGLSGYHSEVRLHEAQGPSGSEAYYGLAIFLPTNWIFHDQNVTFQQWARGDTFGSPWVLMFVENDEIRVGGSGGIRGSLAKITNMQGTWIRVVTHIRHHPTNGLFEVWVNGVKGMSRTGDVSPAPAAPIRWSAGMYCTRWREEQPHGLNPMVLFQDHYRVATSYEEADPASWTDSGSPPPPGPTPDASAPDASGDGVGSDGEAAPAPSDAAPDLRPSPAARRDAAAGAGGSGGEGMEGDDAGATMPVPPPAKPGCACRLPGHGGDGGAPLVVAAAVALGGILVRRARASRRR